MYAWRVRGTVALEDKEPSGHEFAVVTRTEQVEEAVRAGQRGLLGYLTGPMQTVSVDETELIGVVRESAA